MEDIFEPCQSNLSELSDAYPPSSINKVSSEGPNVHLGHPAHVDIFTHEGQAYRTTVSRGAASRTQKLSMKTEVYDSLIDDWTVQGELPVPAIESLLQAVCCKANYSEIAAVIAKKVQGLVSSSSSNPPQIHQFQCQYVGDKLIQAVKCAQEYAELSDASSKHILENVCMKLCQVAEEVERIVLDCCKDQWLQAAVTTLTGFTEHLSSIVFELELCSALLRNSRNQSGVNEILCSISTTEIGIMKEKAATDWEALLAKINAQIGSSNLSKEERQLADYVVKRRQIGSGNIRHDEDTWKVEYRNLQRLGKIGRGASASVHTTLWCGIHFAEKCYSLTNNHEVKHEVAILSNLSHSNIVSLVCYAMGARQCSLVMERMDGDLHNLMEKRMEESVDRSTPFELFEAVHIIRQIAEGMLYLHENKVIHSDLKSANILVKFGKKDVHVKVADFGLSKVKEFSRTFSVQTKNKGTTRWMAPELFVSASDVGLIKHHFKCDIYSFGMVCYEVLTGKVPFDDIESQKEVRQMVLNKERLPLPEQCPKDMADLITCCWDPEPSKRPPFPTICLELRNLHFSLMTEDLPFFIKCSMKEPLPLGYHLATIQDAHKYREAQLSAMPEWEIACLVDGWVDGACYGGLTGSWMDDNHHRPSTLGHKGGILCHFCMKALEDQGRGELTTLKGLISRFLRGKNSENDSFISRLSISESLSHRLSRSDSFFSCLSNLYSWH